MSLSSVQHHRHRACDAETPSPHMPHDAPVPLSLLFRDAALLTLLYNRHKAPRRSNGTRKSPRPPNLSRAIERPSTVQYHDSPPTSAHRFTVARSSCKRSPKRTSRKKFPVRYARSNDGAGTVQNELRTALSRAVGVHTCTVCTLAVLVPYLDRNCTVLLLVRPVRVSTNTTLVPRSYCT
jgi:hypothetical protein